MSESAQAQTALVKAQAIEKIAGAAMLDENEVRLMLDGDPVFGNLEPLDPYDDPGAGDPQCLTAFPCPLRMKPAGMRTSTSAWSKR